MERIYIIEDDENIMNLLKIALEGFGYAAEGFETAEEGLARMKEEKPDLVIFDWRLTPGKSRRTPESSRHSAPGGGWSWPLSPRASPPAPG